LRIFPVMVFVWAGWPTGVWAQSDLPSPAWAAEAAQTLLYGCAPLLIATLGFAGLWLHRIWRRKAPDKPAKAEVAYGKAPFAWAVALLVAGLGLTAYRVHALRQQIYSDAQLNFAHHADRIEADIQSQFNRLLSPLRGIRGLVVASDVVSRRAFGHWVASRDLEREFSGVQGLGMVDRVRRGDLPAFVAAQRRGGAPDFAVHGGGDAADLFIVRYAEPLERNRTAPGYDMGSQAVLRSAAERAMRGGQPVLSERVTLVHDVLKRPGVVYFLPLYSQVKVPATEVERLRAFRGWAYAPIAVATFMEHTVDATQDLVDFQVFDGLDISPSTLLFDSEFPLGASDVASTINSHVNAMFSVARPIEIGGQVFQVRVNTTAGFEHSVDLSAPARQAFMGSAMSILVSLVVWLLLATRARAVAMAANMTRDLSRLALVAQRTSNAVVISDSRQCVTWVNEGFTRITGYRGQEVMGRNIGALLHSENADPAVLSAIQDALQAGQTCRQVLRNRAKDGRDYWVDLEIQPLRSSTGQITGFMSLESDVTEQIQAKEALAREKERSDSVLLGTNVGTWQLNVQTREGRINAQWSAMLGYAPEEVGPHILDFWDRRVQPDDLVRSNNSLAACLSGETESYVCEMRVQHQEGHWIWVLSRAKVLTHTPDGRPEWIAGVHMDITQSKRTEENLRDMEAFLDRAGRVAGVGAWQIDLQTHAITWSAQTCEIHGVQPGFKPTPAQAMGFYPPDAQTALQAATVASLESGMGWDLTLPFTNAHGDPLWVRSVGEVEFDDRGAVRLVGAFQNVTQAKEAQLTLERSEAVLRGAIDAIDEAFVLFDPDDRLVYCNDKYRLLYDKSAEVMQAGETFENLIRRGAENGQYAEAIGRVDAWVAERVAMHQAANGTLEQRLDSGKYLRIVERKTPDGHTVGFRVDITELKNATEAAQSVSTSLAQTSAMLQNVLDSAVNVAVIAMDLSRKITVFNKGAERLLGYQAEEVIGKLTPSKFFDVHQLGIVKESLALLLGREPSMDEIFADVMRSTEQAEWTFVRKDGSTLTVSLMTSAMVGATGELIGHLGMAYDISPQKEYEDSLRHAMVQAEQASVAKSQFLANMSHEIRTPMNAILGMLRLLHNTPLSARQGDYAAKAEGAARSLLGLLNDILDFSKAEAGKMQLDPEPFQLDTLLAELSVILSSNLGSKNVDVLFDVDPAIPQVLVGDAQRIKQVLINLGGNAVKFTSQGEVVVRWRLLTRSADRVVLEIAVRDTGIGIAPENQARIFEGFSQAEASTTRRFGGTGLGLVISQRLVELMGSELVLASALGCGSTFSFKLSLPFSTMALPDSTDRNRMATVVNHVPHVLLVDDNAVALSTSAELMRSLQWEVTQASSGEQALQLVQERLLQGATPFDIIFVDWQMSGMDGWQTLRNVRRLYGSGELPKMVMLSGQGRELLAQRTHREQELLDGFLVKPLTATMFLDVLSSAQRLRSATEIAPSARTPQGLCGMRILVVEDNPINQQVAQELLSAQGALVSLAENGQVGVDAVAAAAPPFDVVLMDLQMPVMGGLDATRAIRHGLGLGQLPVIAMTANAMASDRAACLEAGMNDHVGKPFDLSHLVATLQRHVHWNARPSGAESPVPLSAAIAMDWPKEVDVAGALARMGGNAGLLQRTMRAFVGDAVQISDRVQACLASGKRDAAQREMHALKGLAATLGVGELSAWAARAEAALRQNEVTDTLGPLLEAVRSSLMRMVPVLDAVASQLLPSVPRAVAPDATAQGQAAFTPLQSNAMRRQLGGLLKALRDADMQAMELHAEFRQVFGEALGASMDALDAAMAELDFDLAAVECSALIDRAVQQPASELAQP